MGDLGIGFYYKHFLIGLPAGPVYSPARKKKPLSHRGPEKGNFLHTSYIYGCSRAPLYLTARWLQDNPDQVVEYLIINILLS
jgi:hypothetical protein